MSATVPTIKDKVHKLADQLPSNASWDDVLYRVTLQRSIEKGLTEAKSGLLIPVEDLLKEFDTKG